MTAESPACLNCGAMLTGPFCASCGQEADAHRKPVLGLLSELADSIGNWDSRTLRTLWALIAKPGELPLAFREGRRQRYVPALRLYVFVTLAFFLTLAAADIAIVQIEFRAEQEESGVRIVTSGGEFTMDGVQPSLIFLTPRKTNIEIPEQVRKGIEQANAEIKTEAPASGAETADESARTLGRRMLDGIRQLLEDPAALNRGLTDWIPRVLFILMPIYALLLAAMYWRQGKNFLYVDHLIFALNQHSFLFLVLGVAGVATLLLPDEFINWATLIVLVVYTYLAMRRFYAQSYVRTALKWVAVNLTYFVFLLAPGLLTALVLSLTES